jgi:mono/diheme cytochrome c family protein
MAERLLIQRFARSCQDCHGSGRQLGGFRADQHAAFFGVSGEEPKDPLVVPGNSAASPLIEFVSGGSPSMAMAAKHRLSTEEVDMLRDWIDAGAEWPPKAQLPGEKGP